MDQITNRIGVCARLQDNASGYGDIGRVKRMLDHVGVDMIRTGAIQYAGASSWRNIEKAAALGIRMVMTVRAGRTPAANIADIATFAAKFPGVLIGIEGPNEVDLYPVTFNGMVDAKYAKVPLAALAYQAALAKALKAEPRLAGVPLLNFSDIVQAKQPHGTYVNTHPYPRHGALLSKALPAMLRKWTKRPIVITETGAPNAIDPTWYRAATPETQAAYYVDAIAAVLVQPRISMTFFYQLMDNYPAPTPGGGGMEYHFGLFGNAGDPTPAAGVLRAAMLG